MPTALLSSLSSYIQHAATTFNQTIRLYDSCSSNKRENCTQINAKGNIRARIIVTEENSCMIYVTEVLFSRKVLFFLTTIISKLALGHTWPCILYIPGALTLLVEQPEHAHSLPNSEVKNVWIFNSIPSMMWCLCTGAFYICI